MDYPVSVGTSINFSSIKRVRAPIFQAGMSKYRVNRCSIKHYVGTSINFSTINRAQAPIFQAGTSKYRVDRCSIKHYFGTSINFSSIKRVRAPIFQAGMSKYRVDWCSIKHYFGTSINFLTINHVRALIFQASTSQHRAHELLDAQFNTIRYRWYRSEKSYFYRPDLINLIWSFTRSQNQSVSPIMEVLISAILIGCKIG